MIKDKTIFFESDKSSEIVKSFKYNNSSTFSTITLFILGDFLMKLFLISFVSYL